MPDLASDLILFRLISCLILRMKLALFENYWYHTLRSTIVKQFLLVHQSHSIDGFYMTVYSRSGPRFAEIGHNIYMYIPICQEFPHMHIHCVCYNRLMLCISMQIRFSQCLNVYITDFWWVNWRIRTHTLL